jgi:hypothetical protein
MVQRGASSVADGAAASNAMRHATTVWRMYLEEDTTHALKHTPCRHEDAPDSHRDLDHPRNVAHPPANMARTTHDHEPRSPMMAHDIRNVAHHIKDCTPRQAKSAPRRAKDRLRVPRDAPHPRGGACPGPDGPPPRLDSCPCSRPGARWRATGCATRRARSASPPEHSPRFTW